MAFVFFGIIVKRRERMTQNADNGRPARFGLLARPIGRLGFLLWLPVLWLLGYGAVMLNLATALQYPGHVPENIGWTYFAQWLIFLVPAVFVQAGRLKSVGLPFWIAWPLPVVVLFLILRVASLNFVPFCAVTGAWVALLLLLPPDILKKKRAWDE